MMKARIDRLVAIAVVALGFASGAGAQELAGSFDQLRVLVKTGDTIRVTDDAGHETAGKLMDLTPESLALLVNGHRRDFRDNDVDVVRQRRQDSLANGALWGFGVGAGLGLLAAASWCEYECNPGLVALVTTLYGGVGAGVGVGIDAMIVRNQVIYARRKSLSASVRF